MADIVEGMGFDMQIPPAPQPAPNFTRSAGATFSCAQPPVVSTSSFVAPKKYFELYPVDRIAQFKQIETTMFGGTLQQSRWPPANIADTPEEALSRLFVLPGSHYSDPEFSWKFAVAPAGIGFMSGRGLGPQYEGDLFVAASLCTFERKRAGDNTHGQGARFLRNLRHHGCCASSSAATA